MVARDVERVGALVEQRADLGRAQAALTASKLRRHVLDDDGVLGEEGARRRLFVAGEVVHVAVPAVAAGEPPVARRRP